MVGKEKKEHDDSTHGKREIGFPNLSRFQAVIHDFQEAARSPFGESEDRR